MYVENKTIKKQKKYIKSKYHYQMYCQLNLISNFYRTNYNHS